MHPSTAAILLLFFTFSTNELVVAYKKGVPGRRIGGGTRYELPKPPSFLRNTKFTYF